MARNAYFSNKIAIHKNYPKVLSSTIDRLFNPNCRKPQITPSNTRCEEFAVHFMGKISAIRRDILSIQTTAFNTSESFYLPKETLDSFVLVNAEMLDKAFSSVKATTCILDPIPTAFFKSFYGTFRDELLGMMNCSLQAGVFPAAFKAAVVRPLLKKTNSDFNNLNNYRPVSHLPFLSTILEKLVFTQLKYLFR